MPGRPEASPNAAARPRTLLAAVWIVGLALFAFGASLDGGFVWDDGPTLVGDRRWRGLSFAHLRWMATFVEYGHWQPLTWASLALDHARSGMNPRAYHTTNLLLHALNGVWVFVVARALLQRVSAARRAGTTAIQAGALLAATLFVAHPMRVESVAWITERRDLLSTFFLLGAFHLWLRSRSDGGLARGPYAGALALYAASLASKAWGITFPAVLLVVLVWPLGRLRRGTWRREVALLAPFAVLAGATAVIAVLAQSASGAMELAVEVTPAQRLAVAVFGVVYYPLRTVVPVRLSPLYLLDADVPVVSARSVICAVIVLAAVVACWRARARRPALAAALLAYAIVVLPVLGFAQSGYQEVADRYAYLGIVPLGVLAGGALATSWATRRSLLGFAPAIVLGVLLALGSRAYVPAWKDDLALWSRVIAVDAGNHQGYLNRGLARMRQGELVGAVEDFTVAARLAPGEPEPPTNLGFLAAMSRPPDLPAALAYLDTALEIDPDYAPAHANRAGVLLAMGRPDAALVDMDAAIELDGGSPDEHLGRARILLQLERREDAADALRAVLDSAPEGAPVAREARRRLAAIGADAPR